MEFAILGIIVFFNIVIIIHKFRKNKYADAILDLAILVMVTVVFSGSYGALMVGTVASALISIYLLIKPVRFSPIDIDGW